jgi:hypothetical protein
MDEAKLFLHLDSDYCWRWYVTDARGNRVPVSQPYFSLAEARGAVRVFAAPMAA